MTSDSHCEFCRHLRAGPINACDAFPEGMPLEIFRGLVPHDRPVEGDHGIQFEPRDNLNAFEKATLEGLRFPKGE